MYPFLLANFMTNIKAHSLEYFKNLVNNPCALGTRVILYNNLLFESCDHFVIRFEEWGEYLDVYVNYAGGRRHGEPPEYLGRRRARTNVDWSSHPTTYDYGGAEVTSSRVVSYFCTTLKHKSYHTTL